MSFELTFLGASGGPVELSTCGLMLKPASVSYKEIVENDPNPLLLIDGGSGLYALADIIADPRTVYTRHLLLYPDSGNIEDYVKMPITSPFQDFQNGALAELRRIFSRILTLLLTHPHLDHILALVINLAALPTQRLRRLSVFGSSFCVEALRKHIFNGIIWPDLVLPNIVGLEPVTFNRPFLVNNGYYTVTMMELSHGNVDTGSPYVSLVFLLCDNATQAKLLAFGDFESDLVLETNKNRRVWESVAPHVLDGTLKAIILECSSLTVACGTELYGHLMPPHLIHEMETLRSICGTKTLLGLHTIVTHVKESDALDPRKQVLKELEELNASSGLDLRVSMAVSGILVVI